ncbi:hypothetical protein NC651_024644 [Populus alba x Populus x berolinensis]|nr:hypothetical protein NC651_024644 [Populus alba x Populus x berolinensis]
MLFRHHLYLLLQVTEECLERGIAVCKDGASFKKIGKRIRVMVGCSFSQFDTQIKQQYLNLLFFISDGLLPSVMAGFRLINCNGFIRIEDGSCNNGPGAMVEGETFTIGEFIFWSCLALFDNSIL